MTMRICQRWLCIVLILFPASVLAGSGFFGEGNYWQCILDDMPGVQNDTAADAILSQCQDLYPWSERLFVEKKTPWFGVRTAGECTIKYAKHTPSGRGADAIRAACYKLYPNE